MSRLVLSTASVGLTVYLSTIEFKEGRRQASNAGRGSTLREKFGYTPGERGAGLGGSWEQERMEMQSKHEIKGVMVLEPAGTCSIKQSLANRIRHNWLPIAAKVGAADQFTSSIIGRFGGSA